MDKRRSTKMANKKRALISVSDKTGVVEFAKQLHELDFEIISTGGTSKALEQAGINVTPISNITDFPEILDGRVKTLHPNIFGGLLAIRANENHMKQLDEQQVGLIDLVVVNLYPFKATIEKPNVEWEEAIENIDIGGPSMLRAAAKNYQDVMVVVDPADYSPIIEKLQEGKEVDLDFKKKLAAKVFSHTASYDTYISNYFAKQLGEEFPDKLSLTYEKVQDLRYGENPHQKAAFYRDALSKQGLAQAKQLHGKELSYNNIQDTNAAWEMVKEFNDQPVVVAVKHMNPCGIGVGENLIDAFIKAYEADPVSIFGGIVATNQVIDEETAMRLKEIFLEVIIAPGFTEQALALLTKKKNIRLLELVEEEGMITKKVVSVLGGLLVQDQDKKQVDIEELQIATKRQPTTEELEQLQFAWKVVKHVKSNAIVLANGKQTVGVGAGQMNRVGAAKIAIEQAGELAKGAVMASDAFFPMPDTVEEAAKAGITAIIQPGGSIRDEDSIKEADKHGIAMVFTSVRHFKH